MNNILIDRLPEQVKIAQRDYQIRTDFRIFILFEMLWQDERIEVREKVKRSLSLCYPEIPFYYSEAADALVWFYSCGKEKNSKQKKGSGSFKQKERIYSFEHDADYIYAAFMSQYGIDLQDIEYLHWWKFRALFHSLTRENEFVKIMEYRSVEITADMPKEQQDFYRKMKKMYALPIPKDEEDKQNELEKILMSNGDLSGFLGGD
ncbi:MAG: hypothetical protein HFF79_08130 [Oscillospiraceae bacterium]|nr:hypothetical protein [Oscillospiraceae bacterium]